jgi:methionyl-tRNA formyltransferase
VRALAATSGARLAADGSLLTVWRSRPAPGFRPIDPGTMLVDDGRVLLGTEDGALELVEVQPAGRRRMPASAWARGLRGELPIAARP